MIPLAAVLAAAIAWQDTARSFVTASDIRRICSADDSTFAANIGPDDQPQLRRLCALRLPSRADAPAWASWRRDSLPSPPLVVLYARSFPEPPGVREPEPAAALAFRPSPVFAAAVPPAGPAMSSEAAIILGAANFVTTRAEEEVRTWLVGVIADRLCAAGTPGAYLEATCAYLRTASAQAIPVAASQLQHTVRRDLARLPPRLLASVALDLLPTTPEPSLDAVLGALLASNALGAVLEGRPPLAVFVAMGDLPPPLVDRLKRCRGATGVAFAVWTLFRETVSGAREVRAEDMRWASAARALNAMNGLATWPQACAPPDTARDDVPGPVRELMARAGRIESTLVRLATPNRQFEKAYLESGGQVTDQMRRLRADLEDGAWRMVLSAFGLDVAYRGIDSLAAALVGARRAYAAIAGARYNDALAEVLELLARYQRGAAAGRGLQLFYLAVDVAQAQGPDEVSRALSRVAAPLRSYRAKRRDYRVFAAANAYLGMTAGTEWAAGRRAGVVGGYLPIGLELGLGVGRSSFALLFQAVDLGALVAWRAGSGTEVRTSPKIGVRQVFAPGVGLVWGIPGAPLSLGAAWASYPGLRLEQATGEAANAWRLAAFAGVDVPLAMLWGRGRH